MIGLGLLDVAPNLSRSGDQFVVPADQSVDPMIVHASFSAERRQGRADLARLSMTTLTTSGQGGQPGLTIAVPTTVTSRGQEM
jgi:hypothetical protein